MSATHQPSELATKELPDADDDHTGNGYSMAYMLHYINTRSMGLSAQKDPRQELQDYLKAALRSTGTDPIKWWAVSSLLIAIRNSHSLY
jgi:uncharacterized protein with gpF-like domain